MQLWINIALGGGSFVGLFCLFRFGFDFNLLSSFASAVVWWLFWAMAFER